MALGEEFPQANRVLPGAARRSALEATRHRWRILEEQIRTGHEPCFQTERRHTCGEAACAWRGECLFTRADWLR